MGFLEIYWKAKMKRLSLIVDWASCTWQLASTRKYCDCQQRNATNAKIHSKASLATRAEQDGVYVVASIFLEMLYSAT